MCGVLREAESKTGRGEKKLVKGERRSGRTDYQPIFPTNQTVQSWHCLAYEDDAKPELIRPIQKNCIEES